MLCDAVAAVTVTIVVSLRRPLAELERQQCCTSGTSTPPWAAILFTVCSAPTYLSLSPQSHHHQPPRLPAGPSVLTSLYEAKPGPVPPTWLVMAWNITGYLAACELLKLSSSSNHSNDHQVTIWAGPSNKCRQARAHHHHHILIINQYNENLQVLTAKQQA